MQDAKTKWRLAVFYVADVAKRQSTSHDFCQHAFDLDRPKIFRYELMSWPMSYAIDEVLHTGSLIWSS
jgi:hypothetical protein